MAQNQDYSFFLQGYSALADAGAKVINNSWGSNRRVNSSFAGALGYKPNMIGGMCPNMACNIMMYPKHLSQYLVLRHIFI